MPHHVIINVPPSQQQHSSDLTQSNNGNNRSLPSTGGGAQEEMFPMTTLLVKVAMVLGVLVCGLPVALLVQGGIANNVETKDRMFITVMFFLVCFRYWRYICPQATWSLTVGTPDNQPLLGDNLSRQNDNHPMALPISFISRLYYWSMLISAMTSLVLSIMRLASQDFSRNKVENKAFRDFALNLFYGLALAEALVLLFALTFSVTIMAILEVPYIFHRANPVQSIDRNLVEPANYSERPAGGPSDYSEGATDGPVDYSEGAADGPMNYSEEPADYSDGAADGPADYSDGAADGPAGYSDGAEDSFLLRQDRRRQRRRTVSKESVQSAHRAKKVHPECRGRKHCTFINCIHNVKNRRKWNGIERKSVEGGRKGEELKGMGWA